PSIGVATPTVVAAAKGRAQAPLNADPATATKVPERASNGTDWIHSSQQFSIIPILNPFRHVPMHIVKPEGVRLQTRHGVSLSSRIFPVPPVVLQIFCIVPK